MLRISRTLVVGAVVTGFLIGYQHLAGATQDPKPKSGHESMAKGSGGSDAAKIAKAMSAAPPEISKNATIMEAAEGGPMKQLRAGTNGWMCMTDPMSGDPMCLDKEWQNWADAWMNKKDPQIKAVGIGYMLKGDHGASNTDPYAKTRTADNQWVVSGPHVMVLTPDNNQLAALPTDPQAGGPWVMWKGTKYAHIMVPISSMPKAAAAK